MPTIGTPLQGYYYDSGSDTLRPLAGVGRQGDPGPSMFAVDFVSDATANTTHTAMTAAEDYFGTTVRYLHKMDLVGYTQCRLVMRKLSQAGAAASKVMLKYTTSDPSNTFVPANWIASGAECAMTGVNVTVDSGWITMPPGMQANNIYVLLTISGGDGVVSPVTGSIQAYFRTSGGPGPADTRGVLAWKTGPSGFAVTNVATEIIRLSNVQLRTTRLYKFTVLARAIAVNVAPGYLVFRTPGITVIAGTTLVMDVYGYCGTYPIFGHLHAAQPFTVAADGPYTFPIQVLAAGGTAVSGTAYMDQGGGIMIEDIGLNQGAQ